MNKKLIIFKLIGLVLTITMPIIATINGMHVDDGPWLVMFIVGLLLVFAKEEYLD